MTCANSTGRQMHRHQSWDESAADGANQGLQRGFTMNVCSPTMLYAYDNGEKLKMSDSHSASDQGSACTVGYYDPKKSIVWLANS